MAAAKSSRQKDSFVAFFQKKPVRITMKVLNTLSKCVMTVFLIGVITATVVGCALVIYVMTSFDASENIPELTSSLGETSVIYTRSDPNSSIYDLTNYDVKENVKGANRKWVDYHEIPQYMRDAVVAIEDKRFWTHSGVDWQRTIAAALNMVTRFDDRSFGGSTITQQLIKNLSKDDEISVSRKVREIFTALEMERRGEYSKDEILGTYLNILPLSGNVVGVGAAAEYYFGKENVSELTLAECALIAGVTQNPSKFDPYTRPDNAKARQRDVLAEMFKQELISEEEYYQAFNQELVYNSSQRYIVNDYYDDLLYNDVIQTLGEVTQFGETWAETQLFFGGLKIYSCKDTPSQKAVQKLFEENIPPKRPGDKDYNPPQGAVVVLDYTGMVVATAGGYGEKTGDRWFNRAVDAKRQPGSAMKPIAVYGPAIEYDIATYSTMIQNQPIKVDGKNWPKNDSGGYGGQRTLADMVARSVNTAAVRLMQQLTPKRSYEFLTNTLHIDTLVHNKKINGKVYSDQNLALALGGITEGVRAIDMAAAYQTFGNGGKYNTPYTFVRITQGINEDELYDRQTDTEVKIIDGDAFNSSTAYIMNRIMQKSFQGGGTAEGIGREIKYGNEMFAKTGTTSEDNDVYFMGGSPSFVVAAWFGYDYKQQLITTRPYNQKNQARIIYKDVMNTLNGLKGYSNQRFTKPETITEPQYCTGTGKLANDNCPKATGVYKKSFVPGRCDQH